MTTASILESYNNRPGFELLATSVLRKVKPTCAGIIHTGMNAQGETIVSPIDGLHLIPNSSPPHYVFVHHTTTDRDRLREKWLTEKHADLPKALKLASRIRQKQPNALFTVVLTTNQRLDANLTIDVHLFAASENVSVEFLEQSEITHFLDTTPDGQWLRKEFLGIAAERLSVDLLHQLRRRPLGFTLPGAPIPKLCDHVPGAEQVRAGVCLNKLSQDGLRLGAERDDPPIPTPLFLMPMRAVLPGRLPDGQVAPPHDLHLFRAAPGQEL
jgi:hypothetical protein